MPRLCTLFTVCICASLCSAGEPTLPKPLKQGEKQSTSGWYGQKVYPKKLTKDIEIGTWRDGEERFWTPENLMGCVVREDRDGFLRLFDGHKEGWVKKDDMVTASEAPAFFDKAVKADGNDLRARWLRGISLLETGEAEKAIADFDELIHRDPEDLAAHNSRGRAWANQRENEKAVADFSVVIRLDPKNPVVLINRGTVYDEMKEHDKAIDDYTTALGLDPQSVLALYNRGNSWGKKKRYDKAIDDYSSALKLDPDDAYTLAAKAFASAKVGRYQDATDLFEHSLKSIPQDWVYREFAYFRATCPEGKWRDGKQAVELAKTAIEKAGKGADWEFHATLAAAHAEKGEFDQAMVTQQKAIKLLKAEKTPDTEQLKKAEERLEQYKAKKPFRDE